MFLPAALLASFIIYPVVSILNKITMIGFGEGLFVEIGILILASLWSAAGFVWVGATIAPKNNFVVSVVLSILYGFTLGASFIFQLMLGENSSVSWLELIITIVAGIIAVVGMVRYFYDKEQGVSESSVGDYV